MRVGKIEATILTYAIRRAMSSRSTRFVPKSGALLYHGRHVLSLQAYAWTKSVKSELPSQIYRRLHASFSRALSRLVEKQLIVVKRRKDLTLSEQVDGSGEHHRAARRDTFYALTVSGRRLAMLLLQRSVTR